MTGFSWPGAPFTTTAVRASKRQRFLPTIAARLVCTLLTAASKRASHLAPVQRLNLRIWGSIIIYSIFLNSYSLFTLNCVWFTLSLLKPLPGYPFNVHIVLQCLIVTIRIAMYHPLRVLFGLSSPTFVLCLGKDHPVLKRRQLAVLWMAHNAICLASHWVLSHEHCVLAGHC